MSEKSKDKTQYAPVLQETMPAMNYWSRGDLHGEGGRAAQTQLCWEPSSSMHPASHQDSTYRARWGQRGNHHERLYNLPSSTHQIPGNTEAPERTYPTCPTLTLHGTYQSLKGLRTSLFNSGQLNQKSTLFSFFKFLFSLFKSCSCIYISGCFCFCLCIVQWSLRNIVYVFHLIFYKNMLHYALSHTSNFLFYSLIFSLSLFFSLFSFYFLIIIFHSFNNL